MSVFVGVDGGGTRTRAVVVDEEGRELARAEKEGAVVTAHEPEDAADAVGRAVKEAAAQAGVSLPVAALWAGLAGAGATPARAAVTKQLRRLDLTTRLVVGTDVEAAFHDAFGNGGGILLIAGTGSIVQARDREGGEHRVGGWGRLLGDEGSGYAIGLEGLRAVTRAGDGRIPPTALTAAVLGHCGVESVEDLVGWAERASKREIAALAPVVVQEADSGDESAARIVQDAVDALRTHVEAVLVAMGVAGDPARGPELVLWGGLIAPGGPLEARVRTALEGMGIVPAARIVDPAMGAAKLARASVG